MKTWFITGISRGLGRSLAEAALARGDTVVGTVRSDSPSLREETGTLHVLTLDVADIGAISAAVDEAFRRAGRIDVIVNDAGRGLIGAFEDSTDAETRQLFDVDVFGPLQVIRAALPHLRRQGGGHIVNVTSIAGRAPGAGTSIYVAAKYALEGLSASLSQELAPLGIKVTAVAPGAFRTDFLSNHSLRRSGNAAAAAYRESAGRTADALDAMAGKQIGDPDRGAEAILAAVDSAKPPVHLLLGSDALRRARVKLEALAQEIDTWESATLGTDYAKDAA